MSVAKTQLTLGLSPREIYRLDNFLFDRAETGAALEAFCRFDKPDFLYICGERGCGKTHLLIACAESVQRQGRRVSYLPLEALRHSAGPDVLETAEQTELLCLDDLEAIAGDPDWEEALFHCFNRTREAGTRLLVATTHPPAGLELLLPDLRSRLATGIVYPLSSMSDEHKQRALILQAQSRGLDMSDEVAVYLLRRYGRDMPALMSVLQQLDRASLREKRRLTIPFVRQVLVDG